MWRRNTGAVGLSSINRMNYKTCDTQLLDDELIQDWTEPGLGPGSAALLDPLTNDDTEEM